MRTTNAFSVELENQKGTFVSHLYCVGLLIFLPSFFFLLQQLNKFERRFCVNDMSDLLQEAGVSKSGNFNNFSRFHEPEIWC